MARGCGTYYQPAAQIREVAGVTRTEECRCDVYRGTAEALVAAGLASLDMFPGQPGRPLISAAYRPFLEGQSQRPICWTPGYMVIYRLPSGLFRIAVTVSKDEGERRADAHEKAVEKLREVEGQGREVGPSRVQAAQAALTNMIKSEGEFRLAVVSGFRQMLRFSMSIRTAPADWHAFTLDEGCEEEVHAAFDAIVEAVASARVNFDAERHAAIVQRHRAAIAAGDTAFQASLSSLMPHGAVSSQERLQ